MKRAAIGLLIIVTGRALHHLVQRYCAVHAGDAPAGLGGARDDGADPYDDLPCTD